MNRMGRYTRTVELNIDEYDVPQFFEEELEEFKYLGWPDKIFWMCDCGKRVNENESLDMR